MIFLPSVVLPFPWRAVCLPVLTEHTPVSHYNYKTRVGFTVGFSQDQFKNMARILSGESYLLG